MGLTPLERALRDRIRTEGGLTVEAFMEACNNYYYATRDPLGAAGDFTTAPEISQMFGEIVGAALADCWTRSGSSEGAIYVELGPGRGTLASDALRVLRSAGFAGEIHLVETSPVLRDAQAAALPDAQWHDDLESLPDAPILLVANEFFDALPVRQHVDGVERKIVASGGGLAFDRDGAIVESSPARDSVAAEIGALLDASGGVALIIDYGHALSSPGDTLQAVRGHKFAPVLHTVGEQDLTAHVDFEALARAATIGGVKATPVIGQGRWLNALGIGARAAQLAAVHPERREDIAAAVNRLCDPQEMGQLFKVFALHSRKWPAPAGFNE